MADIAGSVSLKANINAPARGQDFRLYEGDTKTVSFTVSGIVDLTTLPVVEWALTDKVGKVAPEDAADSEDVVLKTLAAGNIILLANVLTFTLTGAETEPLERKAYHHEVRVQGDNGEGLVIATGVMRVSASVLG